MKQFYQIGVKYVNSENKKITENYLLDAVDFTDAEAKARLEFTSFIPEDYTITKIVKTKFSEIIQSDAERYYKARVAFVALDENSGKSKRVIEDSLVQADSVKEAEGLISEAWAKVVLGVEIVSVSESKILEVFEGKEGEK